MKAEGLKPSPKKCTLLMARKHVRKGAAGWGSRILTSQSIICVLNLLGRVFGYVISQTEQE